MKSSPPTYKDPASEKAPGLTILAALGNLSPANFGFVMATGIISIASYQRGMHGIAQALFQLNIYVYCVLWLLTLFRMGYHTRRFFSDIVNHTRGLGFFTLVAATSVLGGQFIVIAGDLRAGILLWGVATLLWMALTYAVFAGLTIKENKPSLAQGISGSWLLAVVATQSVAVLTVLVVGSMAQPEKLEMNFFALSMWLSGGMLYIWLMSLIFYRCVFFSLSAEDFTPPYWINMGAMAISTLAGSLLIINAPTAPFLNSLLPFLKGFTIFYWATATWWIPLLIALALWRHIWKRFPMKYDPLYWGAIFPLGMYAASTHELLVAMKFEFFDFLPTVFLYLAFFAWGITTAALALKLIRRSHIPAA